MKKILAIIVLTILFSAIYSCNQKVPSYNFAENPYEFIEVPYRAHVVHHEFNVTVTTYYATTSCCDSDPWLTASGFRFDTSRSGSYRICAVSRNLLWYNNGPFRYGDKIFVSGDEHFSGMWIVQDTMHERFRNYVDLLVDTGSKTTKFKGSARKCSL